MSQKQAKNIADIATLAGVTPASVSLAFRDSPELSDKLKQRIRIIAAAHNFKPRKYNRRVSSKPGVSRNKSDDKVLYIQCSGDKDPVGSVILQSVMKRLNEQGIAFEVCSRSELLEKGLPDFNITGVIYHYDLNDEGLEAKLRHLPAIKVLGRVYLEKIKTLDYLGVNNYRVGCLAAEHLISKGFKKCIGVLRDDMTGSSRERMGVFADKLRENGAEYHQLVYSRQGNISRELNDYLEASAGKLGIFAFNDIACFNVCTTLDVMGVKRDSEHVEVISCDNTHLLNQLSPVPPAIDLHISYLGLRAADTMIWRLQNPGMRGIVSYIDPELVVHS